MLNCFIEDDIDLKMVERTQEKGLFDISNLVDPAESPEPSNQYCNSQTKSIGQELDS